MKIFGNKKPAAELVTTGRFELERDGHVASLQYTVAGHVLALLHSEIPEALRGSGIASTLAQTALDWAREHRPKDGASSYSLTSGVYRRTIPTVARDRDSSGRPPCPCMTMSATTVTKPSN